MYRILYIALPAFFPGNDGEREGDVRMHYLTIISFVSDYDMRKLFCFPTAKNVRTSSLAFLHYYSNNTAENSSVRPWLLPRYEKHAHIFNKGIILHLISTYKNEISEELKKTTVKNSRAAPLTIFFSLRTLN